MTELVHKGHLTLPELISKFTKGPAELLNLPIGSITTGRTADVTILDPDREYTVNKNDFFSKSRNTPFDGYQAKGRVAATFVDGVCVYSLLDEE